MLEKYYDEVLEEYVVNEKDIIAKLTNRIEELKEDIECMYELKEKLPNEKWRYENQQGDTYTCLDCDYKYQTKNIAGISFKCPRCRSDNLENLSLNERIEGVNNYPNVIKGNEEEVYKFEKELLKLRKELKKELEIFNKKDQEPRIKKAMEVIEKHKKLIEELDV